MTNATKFHFCCVRTLGNVRDFSGLCAYSEHFADVMVECAHDADYVRIVCSPGRGLGGAISPPGLRLGRRGVEIATGCAPGMDTLTKLDLAKILDLAEQGVLGKLVEMESADGDIIEVVVE